MQSNSTTQPSQAVLEAIKLIDEINERSTSRAFYGIDQPLHAKLCTIRATLARFERDTEKRVRESLAGEANVERVARLEAAVDRAAKQFERYAAMHYAKGTADGDEKGIVNGALAEQMRFALATLESAPSGAQRTTDAG